MRTSRARSTLVRLAIPLSTALALAACAGREPTPQGGPGGATPTGGAGGAGGAEPTASAGSGGATTSAAASGGAGTGTSTGTGTSSGTTTSTATGTSSGTTTSTATGTSSGTTTSTSTATSTDTGTTTSTSTSNGPPPAGEVPSDPVTLPLAGSHATYDVGPGLAYEEPDTVPWGALVAGDVVNVHARPAPYKWKLCLRGRGTADAPIVIHGVTDAAGHRPVFDFDGARTASGCNPGGGADVFDTSSKYSLEDYAGLVVRPGVSDPYGTKPAHLRIENLELVGARPGAKFTNLAGQVVPYIGSPAGVWVQPSTDVVLENDVIHDHGFGVFTMAKDGSLATACERIVLRSNRIHGNGVVGSYLEHNVYMQSTNPIVEGNYLGVTRPGSLGSSYKSRSSGEIFRYNWVEASARAIDWVEAQDQAQGVAAQADYGVDYAYGNVVVNDCALGACAANPIHYGGDQEGEQGTSATELVTKTPYRRHLFFYANTLVSRVGTKTAYHVTAFQPSLRATTIDAWDDVFAFTGDAHATWIDLAGQAHLVGASLVQGDVAPASDQAAAPNVAVTTTGLVHGDPRFVSAADLTPGSGSAALDAAKGPPAGVTLDPAYAELPVTRQPRLGTNGTSPRAARGPALDLGALEAK
jgi:hypothetical protein